VWYADPRRAVASWVLTWQRIAVDVAIVSGLVMLALLVYVAWERLSRQRRLVPYHVGVYEGNRRRRTFAELLIDCEEDRTLRAVLVGMLRDHRS
jgi:hypothetical protein